MRNSSLQFDFNQAVAEARRDYPKETANITFIDLSKFGARRRIENFYREAFRADGASPAWLNSAEGMAEVKRMVDEDYSGNKGRTAFSVKYDTSLGRSFRLVAVRTKKFEACGFRLLDDLRFKFDHELGHVIAPNGIMGGRPDEEVADAFAAMRGLKRGTLTKDDIVELIQERDKHASVVGVMSHYTIWSLSKLRGMLEHIDSDTLTPEKIKETATQFGSKRPSP